MVAGILAVGCAAELDSAEVEAAQATRMGQFIPRTLPRLQRRARVRVAVLGDEISRFGFGPGEELAQSWHHQLLAQLAAKFYYGGGVRIFGAKPPPPAPKLAEGEVPPPRTWPPRGEIPNLTEVIPGAPEIVLRNFSRRGATAVQALQPLTTEAFDEPTDLVIWMYGANDALTGVPVASYRQALEAAIQQCQDHKADMIIATPPLLYGVDRAGLARTVDYAAAARAVAAQAHLLCWDMTAALGNIALPLPESAENALPAYLKALQAYYPPDRPLPNAAGQAVMAQAAWDQLRASAPTPFTARGSYTLPNAPLPPAGDGAPNLEITLLQPATTEHPAAEFSGGLLTVLELAGGWKRTGDATIPIKTFTDHRTLRMPLSAASSSQPLGETVNAGFILYTADRAALMSIPAVVVPISLDIPAQRLEGVAGDLMIEATITNHTKAEFRANAQIEWLGKTTTMAIALEGNAERPSSKPLNLRLTLPEGNALHSDLHIRLQSPDRSYDFTRTIDATRNFLPSTRLSFSGNPPTATTPSLTVKVSPVSLTCTFELPAAKPAAEGSVSLMIDARDALTRGKPGFIDAWTLPLPALDGPIPIKKLAPACFGNGYDREIDPSYLQASLTTSISGTRIVDILIPKADFYLHQWSLNDRGENKLGFNARIHLPDQPTPIQGLTQSAFSPNDTASLGVLQLTPKSTGEWTVRVF